MYAPSESWHHMSAIYQPFPLPRRLRESAATTIITACMKENPREEKATVKVRHILKIYRERNSYRLDFWNT